MKSFFRRLFDKPLPSLRGRLTANEWPSVIYAIGDVHGCRAELDQLHKMIIADAASVTGDKWIVMVGDYVDRGPRSADVLDMLCAAPPQGFQRFCLAGNHEVMMLEFIDNVDIESSWLKFGGLDTLASYGIELDGFRNANSSKRKMIIDSHIPSEHIEFLSALPLSLSLPDVVFVHAGIVPGIEMSDQSETDLLWIREPFLTGGGEASPLVVHGHTPQDEAQVLPHRIGIDTGAFATGILTAVRLAPGQAPRFLDTR